MQNLDQQALRERLRQAESALERSDRLAMASLYAGAAMHEVNNPLEAITNLVYLTMLQNNHPEKVKENMLIIELQLGTLGRITRLALTFYREQPSAGEFDLVEIAECALRLHADKLRRHNVSVDRQFRGPAFAKVFGSEILQVLSNLILNSIDALSGRAGKLAVRVSITGATAHITVAVRLSPHTPGRGRAHGRSLQ
jgi:C4-dicarboxylate-specific signal transduction histidine kinase